MNSRYSKGQQVSAIQLQDPDILNRISVLLSTINSSIRTDMGLKQNIPYVEEYYSLLQRYQQEAKNLAGQVQVGERGLLGMTRDYEIQPMLVNLENKLVELMFAILDGRSLLYPSSLQGGYNSPDIY